MSLCLSVCLPCVSQRMNVCVGYNNSLAQLLCFRFFSMAAPFPVFWCLGKHLFLECKCSRGISDRSCHWPSKMFLFAKHVLGSQQIPQQILPVSQIEHTEHVCACSAETHLVQYKLGNFELSSSFEPEVLSFRTASGSTLSEELLRCSPNLFIYLFVCLFV